MEIEMIIEMVLNLKMEQTGRKIIEKKTNRQTWWNESEMKGGFDMKKQKNWKEAKRSNNKSEKFIIDLLWDKNFTADVFQNRIFDTIKRRINVYFQVPKLDYLPEGSFKAILDENKQNKMKIYHVLYQTKIDCFDCRNDWLVRDGKKDQLTYHASSFNLVVLI